MFIDETWTTTNMTRSHGRCARGERLRMGLPHGHRKTTTLVAGLRMSGMVVPMVLDGAINGDWFEAYVAQVLARPNCGPETFPTSAGTGPSWITCRATNGHRYKPCAMPSLRHSSAMLSSPRKPSNTILILLSAEKCRRVLRRMSFTTYSAGFLALECFGLIFVPSSLRRDPNPP